MHKFRQIAWLGACLFLFPLFWQSMHRLSHLSQPQCEGTCETSHDATGSQHYAASAHCAVCEYQLVLPAIVAVQVDSPKPQLHFFHYRDFHSASLFIVPSDARSTRAPPAAA